MTTFDEFDDVDADADAGYLTGQLLVAMPGMTDERFQQTVIYMCAHNAEGAMGLVLNKPMESVTFPDLLEQLDIQPAPHFKPIEVHFGGPVETGRGFVLHSPDYLKEATMMVDDQIALTATLDIIQAIANGEGPRHSLFALGYAGWAPGQLDSEIRANGWLHVAADDELVFGDRPEFKWEHAMTKIGIDPRMLSDQAGHA